MLVQKFPLEVQILPLQHLQLRPLHTCMHDGVREDVCAMCECRQAGMSAAGRIQRHATKTGLTDRDVLGVPIKTSGLLRISESLEAF